MKTNPADIRTHSFNKALRGFDVDEVEVFLEKLADELDELQKENFRLNEEVEKMSERVNEYRKIEKNLQDALIAAQESSNRAADSARKQANLIIKESELKARQIVEKAKEEAGNIRTSVYRLREERDIIIAKLKSIVETQEKLLNKDNSNIKLKTTRVITETKKDSSEEINVDNILEKLL